MLLFLIKKGYVSKFLNFFSRTQIYNMDSNRNIIFVKKMYFNILFITKTLNDLKKVKKLNL